MQGILLIPFIQGMISCPRDSSDITEALKKALYNQVWLWHVWETKETSLEVSQLIHLHCR